MFTMLIAWSVWHIMYNGKLFPEPISKGIIAFASLPSNIYHTLNPTSVPYNIFDRRQITDTSSKDGAILFSDTNNFASNLYLISTFKTANQVEIKLMNLPTGNIFKI